MSARRLPAVLLGIALTLNVAAALSGSHIDPSANDMLLHGQMVERASATLTDFGWGAFQDPWFPELNGGYPLFHHYPHVPHHLTAVASAALRVDPWVALSVSTFLALLLCPLATFVGGRWLGLSRVSAAAAALVFATVRSLDRFGHTPLEYGFMGLGLFGQLWGMLFATLALPAWVAACTADGAGLHALPRWGRILLAGLLASLVVRSSLPAGYLLGICAVTVLAFAGPARALHRRAGLCAAVGVVTVALSAGFLLPFAQDLGATNSTVLELAADRRDSVGALLVLRRLVGGFYLDGEGTGPWTLLLLATVIGVLGARLRRGGAARPAPVLVGLVAATLVSVLLLFGRATWGQWLADLPLLGRFHDHRYLLGLHLLAPRVIGAGFEAAADALRSARGPRVAAVAAGGVIAVAVGLQAIALRADRSEHQATVRQFEAARPALDALLLEARAAGGRVAMAAPDTLLGGTTRLSWLRRSGVPTMGRPLHHYGHIHDFALYWTGWIAGEMDPASRPVSERDLGVAGVRRLLGPSGRAGSRTAPGLDAALVRSDLLVRAGGSNLEGLPLRWFEDGMHLAGQHPSLDLGVGLQPAREDYLRATALVDRDIEALRGLPHGTGLGAVTRVDQGARPGDLDVEVEVTGEGAWVMVPTAWHPRWTARLDGAPTRHHMLTPGWIGVPVTPGSRKISLEWRPAPWRGPWAALNVAIYVLGSALLLRTWRRTRGA